MTERHNVVMAHNAITVDYGTWQARVTFDPTSGPDYPWFAADNSTGEWIIHDTYATLGEALAWAGNLADSDDWIS